MSNVTVTQEGERNQIPIVGGWTSRSTVRWSSFSGWLLLACFFVPLAQGCNGEVISPVNILNNPATHLTDYVLQGVWIGLYANGALWSVVIWFAAAWRSQSIFQAALRLQLVLTALLLLIWLMSGLLTNTLRESVEATLAIAPITLLVLWAVGKALAENRPIKAWARLQLLWLLSFAGLTQLQIAISRDLRWGYFVSLLAAAIHFRSIHVVQNRIEHELWDANHPVSSFQFSIRQTLIWTTVLAALLAYYQNLHNLVDWLFPGS